MRIFAFVCQWWNDQCKNIQKATRLCQLGREYIVLGLYFKWEIFFLLFHDDDMGRNMFVRKTDFFRYLVEIKL